ncbi:MAG: 3-dehydroquinate dehydratase [Bacteroidales bacterium]|jgi:3-dehydroquinate dehydratase-2|nr:3-dehydroquinate dehydratase [Bacteroidales bacterium]
MKINIINGPNLNLLGIREPEKYGKMPFEACIDSLQIRFPEVAFGYFQSNVEGELINELHRSAGLFDGIVFNPGGYSHTSVALHDAVAAIKTPVAEVHITNVFAREEFRHKDLISGACAGTVSGFGMDGYRLAVEAILEIQK